MSRSAWIWVSALLLLNYAYGFLRALYDPLHGYNPELVAAAGVIVLAEFISVHAGGFAPMVAAAPTTTKRAAVAAAFCLLYSVFLYVIWTIAPYPRIVTGLALLIVVRYVNAALGGGGLGELGIRAGVNLFVYFGLAFAFLVIYPKGFPTFGFDAYALVQLRAYGSPRGFWVQEPQRAVAWCATYFFTLGALELLWLRRGGPPAADTIMLGESGLRLQVARNAFHILPRGGTNWNAVWALLMAGMFGVLGGSGAMALVAHPSRVGWFGLVFTIVPLAATGMALWTGVIALGRKSGLSVQGGVLRVWETWFGRDVASASVPATGIVSLLPPPGAEHAQDDPCGLHFVTRDHGGFEIVEDLRYRDAAAFLRLLKWMLEFRWDEPGFEALLRAAPEVRALLGERGVQVMTQGLPAARA